MHGYSHNRPCQVDNLPLYITGAGIADFEQCERSFSQSNICAPLTRHSTQYHRLQAINMHYQHTDELKLLSLGKFIYDNYRQSLRILDENEREIEDLRITKGYGAAQFLEWLSEERDYVQTVGKESPEDKLRCLYVEALDNLRWAE